MYIFPRWYWDLSKHHTLLIQDWEIVLHPQWHLVLPVTSGSVFYMDDNHLITGSQVGWKWIDKFKLPQNVRHADDIFNSKIHQKCYVFIQQKIFLSYLIDNKSSMVRVMAWCRTGDKPLPESMLTQFIGASMYHRSSMSYLQKWVANVCALFRILSKLVEFATSKSPLLALRQSCKHPIFIYPLCVIRYYYVRWY